MASQPNIVPVIATGAVFASYLDAARLNLETMVRLAHGLNDREFATAAQRMLDDFDASAVDAKYLISESDENEAACLDQFWRDSECARARGFDEFGGLAA